jgi:hypothetical protein
MRCRTPLWPPGRAWEASVSRRRSVPWLYRIATNKCLNALRAARRRPAKAWDIAGVEPPEPTRLGELVWLGPFPDSLMDGAFDLPVGPEARLRADRVHFIGVRGRAADAATPTTRGPDPARRPRLPRERSRRHVGDDVAVRQQRPGAGAGEPGSRTSPVAAGVVASDGVPGGGRARRPVCPAYESADLAALVELFTDDIFLSMPPMPLEYEGRDLVAEFFKLLLIPGRRYSLVPTRANGQPAFGAYVGGPDGTRRATGLFAVTLAGDRIRR